MALGDEPGIGPILEGLQPLVNIKKMSQQPRPPALFPGEMYTPTTMLPTAKQEPAATVGMERVPAPITEAEVAGWGQEVQRQRQGFDRELQQLISGQRPDHYLAPPEAPVQPDVLARYAVQGETPIGIPWRAEPEIRPLGTENPEARKALEIAMPLVESGVLYSKEDAAAYIREIEEGKGYVPTEKDYYKHIGRESRLDHPQKYAKATRYGLGRLRRGEASPEELASIYRELPRRLQDDVDIMAEEKHTSRQSGEE